MVLYNILQMICLFEKMVCDFVYLNGYDLIFVFNDFLCYVIYGFFFGVLFFMDWKYKWQQNRYFMEMFIGWIWFMQWEL